MTEESTADNDDIMLLIDEDEADQLPCLDENVEPWRILIVDDDENVHETTVFSLNDTVIFDRPVELLHAYSADEAFDVLNNNPDISVVFLDVVMETVDAGLKLVPRIRHKLKRYSLRIILRTGQPGYAPEDQVVTEYDINDYHTKSEFTYQRMIIALKTALRDYLEMERIANAGKVLKRIIEATESLLLQETVEGFARDLLNHLGSIFSLPVQGFVIVKPVAEKYALVVGSSGKYQRMLYRNIYSIQDNRLTGSAKLSMRNGESFKHEKEVTLYFNSAQFPMVACINPAVEGCRLSCKQYYLDMLSRNISICIGKMPSTMFQGLAEKMIS